MIVWCMRQIYLLKINRNIYWLGQQENGRVQRNMIFHRWPDMLGKLQPLSPKKTKNNLSIYPIASESEFIEMDVEQIYVIFSFNLETQTNKNKNNF